mmetsp:Transcript_1713/g.2739  ORF Transcript_1713/g.2739 Transcript_1713/m.2739 type:complete len:313 (+) Transcript_1713:1003-1941(+)
MLHNLTKCRLSSTQCIDDFLLEPRVELLGDGFSGQRERHRVRIGVGGVKVVTVSGTFDEHRLLAALGQQDRRRVRHAECVPGVDGARRKHDICTGDVDVAELLVNPVHLGIRLPAVEGSEADGSAEVQIQPLPALEWLVFGVGGLEVAELVAGLVRPGSSIVGGVVLSGGQVGHSVRPGCVLACLSVGGAVEGLQSHELRIAVASGRHDTTDVCDVHHTRVLVVVLHGALHIAHQIREQHSQIQVACDGAAGIEVVLQQVHAAGPQSLQSQVRYDLGCQSECIEALLTREVDQRLTYHVHVLLEIGLCGDWS